jgi:two-component system chemotaxis sensor kinase CheA
MTTLENIAQEIVLLDATDTKACKRVAKMLREFSRSTSISMKSREIADEAATWCGKMAKSSSNEADLSQLNDLVNALQKNTEAESREREAPSIIDEDMINEFLQKQESVLDDFEASCLELENGATDQYAALKRQIHTWKGESAILGYQDLSTMMHHIEDSLGELTEAEYGRIPEALLKLKDLLDTYFKQALVQGERSITEAEEVVRLLKGEGTAIPEPAKCITVVQPEETPPAKTHEEASAPRSFEFIIPADIDQELVQEFRAESDEHISNAEVALMTLESDPTDMNAVNVVFRAFHTIKGVASFIGVSYITETAHKAENFLDRIRKGQLVMEGTNTDLAFEALDTLKKMISSLDETIQNGKYQAGPEYFARINRLENPEMAVAGAEDHIPAQATASETANIAGSLEPLIVENQTISGIRTSGDSAVAADPAQAVRSQPSDTAGNRPKEGEGTIKISTSRLDNLINSVGELVIAQSMVSQDPTVQSTSSQSLARNVSQLVKITRSLQELALSMRMVSVKPTFQKMARLVRDLARKSGKEVQFEMLGEDTELDRNMVEAIADPLVHMVRNAVDHGIEKADVRLAAGKPSQGTVTLSAAHEGGSVNITLRDDGKGLDKDRIYAKAVERGLVEPGSQISDHEMYNLIFQPGFSTAEKVTDVSGRGVGMDVVRTNIEKLRGSVVIDSKAGQGSVFKMRLPLTLAIIDGMVIRIGGQRFIIPIVTITESFRPQAKEIVTVRGQTELVQLRGGLLPIYRLHRIFDIPEATQRLEDGILVVAEGKGRRIALMVDELLGQQQVVIKRLGNMFDAMKAVSGGAILGDGAVSLILNIEGIIQQCGNAS